MNEIESVLEECLRRMSAEGYSVEQCLAQHPAEAAQLRPLLMAAGELHAVRALAPSHAFRDRTRAKLITFAEAHTRRPRSSFQRVPQLAMMVTLLVAVMLASTTAFAQAALPGEPLYTWKLSSEHVWWIVASDRVEVDLTLVERRALELTKLASDPGRQAQARDELHEVLTRLEKEADDTNGPEIEQALLAHQKRLSEAGIHDEKLDKLVHGKKR